MAGTQIKFVTHSPEETSRLGQQIGEHLKPGTIIAFSGDLGSGKTTFVKGVAKGLHIPESDYITSPTYTLINEYKGRCRLFHIDLYRIDKEEEIEDTGIDEILSGDNVTAIEWSEKLPGTFFSDHVSIVLKIINDLSRQINIIGYGHEAENLVEEIRN